MNLYKRGEVAGGVKPGAAALVKTLKEEGVMIMKEELTNKGINIMVPFLVGGVVGAGLALLFAPKPGKEIRDDVKRFTTTTKDRVVLALDKGIDKGKELYEEGRTAVASAIDAGKNVIDAGKSAIDVGKNAYIQEKEKWQHA